jgi:hypothetical protein
MFVVIVVIGSVSSTSRNAHVTPFAIDEKQINEFDFLIPESKLLSHQSKLNCPERYLDWNNVRGGANTLKRSVEGLLLVFWPLK